MLPKALLRPVARAFMPAVAPKGDQSDDQGVFNQILTLFAAGQILELDVKLKKHGVHFVFLSVGFLVSQP